ncbi:MAG: hypothetical protein HYZ53_26960, partial [Planctomycetes bacterium]|nr:hypothetical protein [Planctomycetota bacterium]
VADSVARSGSSNETFTFAYVKDATPKEREGLLRLYYEAAVARSGKTGFLAGWWDGLERIARSLEADPPARKLEAWQAWMEGRPAGR